MTKHYKSLAVSLGAVILFGLLALLARPKITPSVPIDYQETVNRYAKEYSLSPSLVFGVIKTESNFDPDAQSNRDAYGLMQITEDTLNWAMLREGKNAAYTAEDLYDPEINIKYGCFILSLLLEEFEDLGTALAAYNAGRSNVLKWLKDSRYSEDGITLHTTPYNETNRYMEKVLTYQEKYQKMLGETV